MTKRPFQGTGTAMITPFKADGSVDEKALRRFVDFQIDGGVDMLLPCGTTGEGVTLDADETDRLVSWLGDLENRTWMAGATPADIADRLSQRGVTAVEARRTPDLWSGVISS